MGGTSESPVSDVVDSALSGEWGSSVTMQLIADCVERVTVAEGFTVNSLLYQNLLVHIAVALLRIEHGCYVPIDPHRLSSMRGTREFAVAQMIAHAIADKTGIILPDEEAAYIAIHLAGKQTLYAPEDDRGLVISDEVWDLVSRMLELVWQAFRFDFRGDLELRMNLARHIVPLSVRLRYNMKLKNPMLADIKRRYPLAFSMAVDASSILVKRYGSTLSEDEVAYIALAFALALERQKSQPAKKKVLMVCATGTGSARLLEFRYLKEFGEYIDSITTCDVLHIDTVDFSDIDYVFTTVPLHRDLPVPVREVQFFLDDIREVEDVRELLRGAAPSRISNQDRLSPYFDSRLFLPHLSASSKQEALDVLLDCVCQCKVVSDNFRELVWKREALAATSFGNLVAMPHPMQVSSQESFVCVAILEEPIEWDGFGHEVQLVFLTALSDAGGVEQHAFLETLSRFMVSSFGVQSLIEQRRLDKLLDLLAHFSEASKPASDSTNY